ncbi:hypothetical protein GCM10011531_07500 [Aquaticitalea lipolytica]|jgi:hypothetical protein|uniref:TonB-dependent receptor plug domain-containing protein n=1 Tax=Aquaticitalea lipolytica TaxID=1247562 RepID=A0A8J2TLF3_9FLAO|nr:hypothetical protein [Aquaticitalea lipolytica]GFZ79998.1 hypothetical protein GCM10011531_07500 [Aquaticitalea lipolytica]
MKKSYTHFQNFIEQSLKTTLLILNICLLATTTVLGQESAQKEAIENAYASYFNAERESIFIHFNKNTFITNEPIWFKGYVYDKKSNIPFVTSTNIYVTLYNSNGDELETKLFYAKNGTFSGNFDVKSSFETGHYYVKAYTNWMKNFKEDETYTSTSIQVLNPNSEQTTNNTNSDFDLQFLPEGGHSIADVNNSIGFKIINCEGIGTEIEGEILNSKNQVITNFKSNNFGIGKVDLQMVNGETYTAKYTVNNKTYSIDLPKCEPYGFSISVNNYTNPKFTYINLKTNNETLKNEANKTYYLAINQTNKSSVTELKINNLKTEHTVTIETEKLLTGVNTITLFNDKLEPLLERLIFKYDENSFVKSKIKVNKAVNDSIKIDVFTSTKNNTPISTNLSVSVLPSESIAYSKKENILSAFLISPYLRGNIENPQYYFTDVDRLKKYDLDLLLLTQGWSKYEWKNIQQGAPNLIFPFDKGLSITGTINEKLDSGSDYKIHMYSFINNIDEVTSIDIDNKFYYKNFYLKDSAKIKFAILKNGNEVKNPKMYLQLTENKRSLITKAFDPIGVCAQIEKKISNPIVINDPFYMEGQLLDTISLFATKKLKERKLTNKNSRFEHAYSKGVKIDSTALLMYPFVTDIINANGFNADQGGGRVSISSRRPISFISGGSPLLIIDDVTLGNNYDMLYLMTLDEIDEIYFNKNGDGYGTRGGGGVITIYRKKGAVYGKMDKLYANQLVVKDGFSTEKKFYIPEFYALSKSDYLNYGSISWKSNISTDLSGNASFNVRNNNIDKAILIIQGFSIDGKLISEFKEINLLD